MTRGHRSVKSIRRSDLARLTGCNLETIRYYENVGILPEPPRTAKNHRVYDDSHVLRLRFVMRARELGFSLDQLRGLLNLVDGGAQTCAEVRGIAAEHLADVRARVADLQRIERVLAETVARCSGDAVPECPVIDALQDVA